MSQAAPQIRTEDEIRRWLVEKICVQLQIDPAELNLDEPLIAHGVDSMKLAAAIGELEDWLGCRFVDNPLIDYPTVNALSHFIAGQLKQGKTKLDPLSDPSE